MGILFENMDKIDIQAERRKTAEEKARADVAEARADEQKARAVTEETRAINAEAEIKRLQNLLAQNHIKS